MKERIRMVGIDSSRNRVDIPVGYKENLEDRMAQANYQRLFMPYGEGLCVERLLDNDKCYARIHLNKKPLFDFTPAKGAYWREIMNTCKAISSMLPQVCDCIGIDRQDGVKCNLLAPLPDIDDLNWISLDKQPEAAKPEESGKAKKAKSKKAGANKAKSKEAMPEKAQAADGCEHVKIAVDANLHEFDRKSGFLRRFKPVGKQVKLAKAKKARAGNGKAKVAIAA